MVSFVVFQETHCSGRYELLRYEEHGSIARSEALAESAVITKGSGTTASSCLIPTSASVPSQPNLDGYTVEQIELGTVFDLFELPTTLVCESEPFLNEHTTPTSSTCNFG